MRTVDVAGDFNQCERKKNLLKIGIIQSQLAFALNDPLRIPGDFPDDDYPVDSQGSSGTECKLTRGKRSERYLALRMAEPAI